MNSDDYPWRRSLNLNEVFAIVQPVFASMKIVAPCGGCAQSEIEAAERRMGKVMPDDIRAFYLAMHPTRIFAKDEGSGAGFLQSAHSGKDFGFYQLQSKNLKWQSMEGAEPSEEWIGATGLALGQSVFGDPFWWIEGHRQFPSGSIVVFNHDGGLGGDIAFVRYARTFREFVAKLAYFKCLCSATDDELYLREFAELNQ